MKITHHVRASIVMDNQIEKTIQNLLCEIFSAVGKGFRFLDHSITTTSVQGGGVRVTVSALFEREEQSPTGSPTIS